MTDKSINASERLETPIMGLTSKAFVVILNEMYEVAMGNPQYNRRNGGLTGITSQDSIETTI